MRLAHLTTTDLGMTPKQAASTQSCFSTSTESILLILYLISKYKTEKLFGNKESTIQQYFM
jgi:hypothetical protein